jgi:hypothetical protein
MGMVWMANKLGRDDRSLHPSQAQAPKIYGLESFILQQPRLLVLAAHLQPAPKRSFALLPGAEGVHYDDPCDYWIVLKFMGGLGRLGE